VSLLSGIVNTLFGQGSYENVSESVTSYLGLWDIPMQPSCFTAPRPRSESQEINYNRVLTARSKRRIAEMERLEAKREQKQIEETRQKKARKERLQATVKPKWEFTLDHMEDLQRIIQMSRRMNPSHDGQSYHIEPGHGCEREQWLYDQHFSTAASMIRRARAMAPAGFIASSEYYMRAKDLGLV
jgi:hypothetical protein